MNQQPRIKRENLRRLVAAKQQAAAPLASTDKEKGFLGWHERGYLPHCDKPGLVQFITFRLWDSMPESRRSEWEHLLNLNARSNAPRSESDEQTSHEQRRKLEEYLDRGHGDCFLRDARVAMLLEKAILFHHGKQFELLAWVIMPNHFHAALVIGDTPLARIAQNWKSIVAVKANQVLRRTGRFWQPEYWDRYMRDEEQTRKAIRYIENNPVKAKLCRAPEDWPFSSARFRNPKSRTLELPQ